MKGTKNITKNTYAIHWHTLSWTPQKTHVLRFIRTKIFLPLVGREKGLNMINKILSKGKNK